MAVQKYKIKVESSDGGYENKKEFTVQVNLTERQFLFLGAAIIDHLEKHGIEK